MAIQFLTKEKIDPEKWDRCVRSSSPALPYALFGYLNISTLGHFAGLVLDDYEAIMPIPLRGKQILQPFISQQLGVFSAKTMDPLPFYQKLPALANRIYLKIHNSPAFQPGTHFEKKTRTNFLLNLNQNYAAIQKGYSKTLRKRLRRQKEDVKVIEDVPLTNVIAAYKNNLENKVKVGEAKYLQAETLFKYCLEHDMAKTFQIEDDQAELLAIGIFIFFEKRIINVFAASTELGKAKQGMALLLDAIFEKYSSQEWLFDFEGSDIPGVKAFFQSFGPKEQRYLELILDQRSWWRKAWDKFTTA